MRNITIIFMITLLSCNTRTDRTSEQKNDLTNVNNSTKSKYNPKVDKEYFYPEEEKSIIWDTLYQDYKIKTSIIPVKNVAVIIYSEYLDQIDNKFKRDKIKCREYNLIVEITDKNGLKIKKQISKYDFRTILKPKPDNYFIRQIGFRGLNKTEFQFDIKLSILNSDNPDGMIKYYISTNEKIRFEDYPKSFYDSIFGSPDE